MELDCDSDKYLDYINAKKLNHDKLPPDFFDAIVASHVVEHFADTTVALQLRNMIQSLKPSGYLLVEVLNAAHTFMHTQKIKPAYAVFQTRRLT